MNKGKEKGVATSLLALAHCWPLASLVLRRHVFSVGTCSPSARVLPKPASESKNPHFTSTHTQPVLPWRCFSLSLFTHATFSSAFLHVRFGTSAQLRVPPSSGASHPLSANRERTRLLPPAFLVTVTGRFLHQHLADVLADFPFLHASTVKPPSFVRSFGGKSPR